MFISLVPAQDSVQSSRDSQFTTAVQALRAARPIRHPRLREAEAALLNNQPEVANNLLAPFLDKHPKDASALHLMAEAALRRDRRNEALELLARCLALAPDHDAARLSYANTLLDLNRGDAAMAEIERLLARDPCNLLYRALEAAARSRMGQHERALAVYEALAADYPQSPDVWINYGNALKSVGQTDRCVSALRKALALQPSRGEAWWSLANLKTFRFADIDVTAMQEELARSTLSPDDRASLHFSLGKAFADAQRYEKAFENYAKANALKRLRIVYDPGTITNHVATCRALFTADFLAARRESGCEDDAPIFVLGMQRAGSTLVEQILGSHSAIETTAELPDITLLAQHLGDEIAPRHGTSYPRVLERLDRSVFGEFGEAYLESTRFRRRASRPFFVDKMPYNFLHVGLIHLILPRAKIIDARRHPLACCFSNFASNFTFGPLFGHRLSELGRAYADYVGLMAHFDRLLPGRIHRIYYEDLVREPEREIRRLLDHLELPFETACLEFHRNTRAMDSASSEQVRRPLYTEALEEWRHYEPWLGPLKAALGPLLDAYPNVPRFGP